MQQRVNILMSQRLDIPEKNSLVLIEITKIAKHGLYCKLKEFEGITAYCHISEIAGTFIRNIRNHVKVGQNSVAKVLRVDYGTKQVDVSLKRVNDSHKREKLQEYKRQNAAIAIINLIAKKMSKSEDQIRDDIEPLFLNMFGNLYSGFEEVAATEGQIVEEMDIADDLKEAIVAVAAMSIQISTVTVTSNLGVRSFAPDGVRHVRELLVAAEATANQFEEVESEITTIGAPQYRVHLEGRSYDEVLEVLDAIEAEMERVSKGLNVEYILERKKN